MDDEFDDAGFDDMPEACPGCGWPVRDCDCDDPEEFEDEEA